MGWDHVLGQRGAEERAQLIHEVGGRVVGDYVGDQALVPRGVLAREDHHLADRRVPGDARFDLAQLNAKAAQLDLMVGSALVLNVAVG